MQRTYPQTVIDIRGQSEMVRHRGEIVQWWQGAPCPCGSSPTQARVDCEACHGKGRLYFGPRYIIGLIVDARQDKVLRETGVVVAGDLSFSQDPFSSDVLNDWDLILPTWLEGQPFEGETLVRRPGPADELMYRPSQMLSVLRVDPLVGTVIQYRPQLDYTISGKLLAWPPGAPEPAPAVGERYSAVYRALFEYVAFAPPIARYERGSSLGQRVLMRKRHIALDMLQQETL